MPDDDCLVTGPSRVGDDEHNDENVPGNVPGLTTSNAALQEQAKEINFRIDRNARNISVFFDAATAQLKPGDLIKDDLFTLFEAVGALEIMDAKMDSGCIPPGDIFESDFDVCEGRSTLEVVWIMDELFKLEMAFHDGYSLSQNIFTSLYVFRLIAPDKKYPYNFYSDSANLRVAAPEADHLVHTVLRAYCIGLVKSVEMALRLIQSHMFFEEEDFIAHLYGRELLPKLDLKEAFMILSDAIDWVDNSNIDNTSKTALRRRLLLREDALFAFDQGGLEAWQDLKARVPPVIEDHDTAQPIDAAFSTKVQRQLATSAPPRTISHISWQDACTKWLKLCDDMISAHHLSSVWVRSSPHQLQRAAWAFTYRQPLPNTYARAKMQDILTANEKVADDMPHYDLFLADIRDLVLAGDPLGDIASFQVEVTSDVRHRASRIIEDFMSKAFGEYLNLYRILCQNRCRVRRHLTQSLPILAELEGEAIRADAALNATITPRRHIDRFGDTMLLNPLTLWMSIYRGNITQWVVQLGLETDLYLPDEFSTMYLVLSDILTDKLSALRQSGLFMTDRQAFLKRAGNAAYLEECQEAMKFLESLQIESDVALILAGCLADIFALLEKLGVIDTTLKKSESGSLRYEARMKPLLKAEPQRWRTLASIAEMQRSKSLTVPLVCEQVPRAAKDAKTLLTKLKTYAPSEARYIGTEDIWNKEIKQLETVCVAMTVTASQLLAVSKQFGEEGDNAMREHLDVILPPPGKRYHDWWVIPQIKKK